MRARSAALLVLFFFSGASGLVYEVVWFRMLIRTFGVTVYAVSTVLAVYMAGLAAGSLLVGRGRRSSHHLLRLYGIIELLVGASAFVSTRAMLWLPSVYHATPLALRGGAVGQTLVRITLAAAVLAIPTVLMGATLPVISSYLAARRGSLGKQVGFLYGANTLGAVIGVLASGFILLETLGEKGTVNVAVVVNLAVGALAWLLSRREAPVDAAPPAASGGVNPYARLVLAVYAISGFCALAYEVVWSRILSLLLGNSVYGFSLMLGAYLAGIALGSLILSRWADRLRRPLVVLAALEIGVSLMALASMFLVTAIGLRENQARFTYAQIAGMADFWRMTVHALVIVVPVTLILGAMFPVASRLCLRAEETTERSIGRLYGGNTIGAILGSLLTGFLLFRVMGTLLSFLLAAAVSCALGLVLLHRSQASGRRVATLLAGLLFVTGLSFSFRDPFYTILRARMDAQETTLANRENPSATVTLTGTADGGRHLYINGVHTSDTTNYLADMLVTLPLSFQPEPRRSLIIGLGVGDAFSGSVVAGLDTTAVDLQPAVIELFEQFAPGSKRFTGDPKAHIVIADGRNFLLGTDARFDLVVVDGTPPIFASGMVNLYSREFAHLVREHLTPAGVFALWFPTVCFESDFWMMARNFADEFAQFTIWTAPKLGGIILMGSPAPTPIFAADAQVLEERLRVRPRRDRALNADLIRRGQILTAAELRAEAARHPNVTDDRPYTEFPLFRFWRNEPYWYTNGFLLTFAMERHRAPRH